MAELNHTFSISSTVLCALCSSGFAEHEQKTLIAPFSHCVQFQMFCQLHLSIVPSGIP